MLMLQQTLHLQLMTTKEELLRTTMEMEEKK
jgi:hypothetical protein